MRYTKGQCLQKAETPGGHPEDRKALHYNQQCWVTFYLPTGTRLEGSKALRTGLGRSDRDGFLPLDANCWRVATVQYAHGGLTTVQAVRFGRARLRDG
jgi:hypothetical protein